MASDVVNVGYSVFAEHRGRGYASRAVLLLMEHLRESTEWHVATLLIRADPYRRSGAGLGASEWSAIPVHV